MDKNAPTSENRDSPSDLDGKGFSDASYRPGYSVDKSIPGCSENDLKTGYKKGE